MTEKKMTENKKKKNVDIFSLYKKEKLVDFSDNEGNTSSILFVKMTQGELTKALEVYNKAVEEDRKILGDKSENSKSLMNSIKLINVKAKVETILEIELTYREELADMYPIDDEDNEMPEKDKKEAQKVELNKWKKTRKAELEATEESKLDEKLFSLKVDNMSIIRGALEVNKYCISMMARDPKTKEKIFETPDDVLRLKDKVLIDRMIEIVQEFRDSMSGSSVREVAQSSDFSQTGQSQSD